MDKIRLTYTDFLCIAWYPIASNDTVLQSRQVHGFELGNDAV
jgi:hypothetical protein